MNVMVIALDTAGSLETRGVEVLVVAPAINSRLRHWLSDEDEARRKAQARADSCVDHLRRQGVDASGRVGDPDPLQAIADVLPVFSADEIVIAARDGRGGELAARARRRFPLPVRVAEERFLDAA